MIEKLARDAGESVWRRVGEKALITAVTTLLSEAIKASVEVAKKAKLRVHEAEFEDRRARLKKASEAAADGEADGEDDSSEEAADAAGSDEAAESGPTVDFASYVARHRQ